MTHGLTIGPFVLVGPPTIMVDGHALDVGAMSMTYRSSHGEASECTVELSTAYSADLSILEVGDLFVEFAGNRYRARVEWMRVYPPYQQDVTIRFRLQPEHRTEPVSVLESV